MPFIKSSFLNKEEGILTLSSLKYVFPNLATYTVAMIDEWLECMAISVHQVHLIYDLNVASSNPGTFIKTLFGNQGRLYL